MTAVLAAVPSVILGSCREHYGVPVIELGENGEWLAAFGTHDPRRAVAALNRYARTNWGLINLFDDPHATYADAAHAIRQYDAVQVHSCHRGGWDPAHPVVVVRPGDCPCRDCDRAGTWAIRWDLYALPPWAVPFPVTVLEVER